MNIEFVRQEDMDLAKEKGREKGIEKMKNTIMNSLRENTDSARFFGEVTERYLLTIFSDIVRVEKSKNCSIAIPIDWIYHIDQKEVKIKQISSSVRIRINCDGKGYDRSYFQWGIRRNDVPDIFILSGWYSVEKLYYVWVIGSREIVNGREFWNRETFAISNHIFSLNKYSKFLITKDGLENAQDLLEKRFYEIQKQRKYEDDE